MKYVTVPNKIKYNEIVGNQFCLSPSKYLRFQPKKSDYFLTLDKIIVNNTTRKKVERNLIYNYAEIGDIDIQTGYIDFKKFYGLNLPSKTCLEVKKNDILISTVRTYRNGIGIVSLDENNILCTPAMFLIRDVIKPINNFYLLAFLRSDFFIEQILGLQNRGMYPRLDPETSKSVLIPVTNDTSVIDYITLIMKSLLNKETEIRRKKKLIENIIEKEIKDNQNKYKFVYHYPKLNEVVSSTRLDTGTYSNEFKSIDFLIKNYKYDVFYINKKSISSGNTPIQRIIDCNNQFKYKWITPTNISDYGYFTGTDRILFKNKKNNLNKNAMLIINRTSRGGLGEYVGLSAFYDFSLQGPGHHNQGIYQVTGYNDFQLKFMTCFMNSPMIRKYCAGLSVGSKMKEIKSNQISTIPFPNFPEDIQQIIANLYHNQNVTYSLNNIRLDNFISLDDVFNNRAGIIQLVNASNKIKLQLNKIIDNIINDEDVKIDFDFLNT